MIFRIGHVNEISQLIGLLPEPLLREIMRQTELLDVEYGVDRDYMLSGGYSMVVETSEDVVAITRHLDVYSHLCEHVERVECDMEYIHAMYLMNDDFSISVFMPLACAPYVLLNDLED